MTLRWIARSISARSRSASDASPMGRARPRNAPCCAALGFRAGDAEGRLERRLAVRRGRPGRPGAAQGRGAPWRPAPVLSACRELLEPGFDALERDRQFGDLLAAGQVEPLEVDAQDLLEGLLHAQREARHLMQRRGELAGVHGLVCERVAAAFQTWRWPCATSAADRGWRLMAMSAVRSWRAGWVWQACRRSRRALTVPRGPAHRRQPRPAAPGAGGGGRWRGQPQEGVPHCSRDSQAISTAALPAAAAASHDMRLAGASSTISMVRSDRRPRREMRRSARADALEAVPRGAEDGVEIQEAMELPGVVEQFDGTPRLRSRAA